jgi:hypothetical protein
MWIRVVILVFVTLFKRSGWGYLLLNVFGVKRRLLKHMPTSYSFPPTTPSQFPRLDAAELERYTHEFESLGFVRLVDFSQVSDVAKTATQLLPLIRAHPQSLFWRGHPDLSPRSVAHVREMRDARLAAK